MALETVNYVGDLVATNPPGTDPKSQGDDHIRNIKKGLLDSFPGLAGIIVGTATESGSANAYALTLSPTPASYTPLLNALILFKATHANTSAATLNVNALGAKPIVDVNGGALASGDIASGAMVAVFYDGTSFCLVSANDRAPIDSPTFTGTPAAPTPTAADNSTKIATTAYVDTGLALKANLASPALTGTPTAPTAAVGTNTAQIATMAALAQQAFSAALPVQVAPSILVTNGSTASWAAALSGNAGKFLTNDGTGLNWATAQWTQIGAVTASGTVSFTNISGYKDLLLVFEGVTDSGVGTPTLAVGDATPTYATAISISGSNNNLNGAVYLPNVGNDYGAAFVLVQATALSSSPTMATGTPVGFSWRVTGGVKALQVATSSGFTGGTIRLMGR